MFFGFFSKFQIFGLAIFLGNLGNGDVLFRGVTQLRMVEDMGEGSKNRGKVVIFKNFTGILFSNKNYNLPSIST